MNRPSEELVEDVIALYQHLFEKSRGAPGEETYDNSFAFRQVRHLGTQMPSAQNHFYAIVPCSRPFQLLYFSPVFPENLGKQNILKSEIQCYYPRAEHSVPVLQVPLPVCLI